MISNADFKKEIEEIRDLGWRIKLLCVLSKSRDEYGTINAIDLERMLTVIIQGEV